MIMGIYILSVFLSAFLLFQIQPLIGKIILPWFGGTSGVWSTIMLFFQTILTGGYAYAYWLVKQGSRTRQNIIHPILVSGSLVLLGAMSIGGSSPITPDLGAGQYDLQRPVCEISKLLVLLVGLPGFILSANSTLIQTWYTRSNPDKSPYWLFSLSNTGSLLALVTYPILFEPNFTIQAQSWIWAGTYLVFGLVTIFLITRLTIYVPVGESSTQDVQDNGITTRPWHPAMWIGLSATASILLLSTTSHLTQEVAPIPLLWVLPLAIYLLTFILGFSGEGRYRRPMYTLLLTLSSLGILFDLSKPRLHFILQILIYSFFLFSACMIAHGELFRLRPKPSQLSRYYLMISAGGAIGGVFVNLIAPLIFNGYWEFHLGWILIFFLLSVLAYFYPTRELIAPWRKRHDRATIFLTMTFLFLSLYSISGFTKTALYMERNFYGVSKVVYSEFRGAYQYVNGITIHGFQIISEENQSLPTAYFWRDSGIAMVIRNHPRYGNQMNVGVLGLGIGTLAAHGLPGDHYRFYEINPLVIDIGQGKEGYFSFLAECEAEVSIVPGDARISLEQELAKGHAQEFDLLVMDAFSSDSVPVHLITREAFEIYLEHIAPDGVIAVNISNNYIDLIPVIWKLGQELGLKVIHIAPPIQEYHPIGISSSWIFLVRDENTLDAPEIHANADYLADFQSDIRLWTDDYSNILEILRK